MDINPSQIRPDLIVFAKSEGQTVTGRGTHIGTVDHLDGENYIKLKKGDSLDGRHHWIPLESVEKVEGNAVYLNKTEEQLRRTLLDDLPIDTRRAV